MDEILFSMAAYWLILLGHSWYSDHNRHVWHLLSLGVDHVVWLEDQPYRD